MFLEKKYYLRSISLNPVMRTGMMHHLCNYQKNNGPGNHPLFDKDEVLHDQVHDFHLGRPEIMKGIQMISSAK